MHLFRLAILLEKDQHLLSVVAAELEFGVVEVFVGAAGHQRVLRVERERPAAELVRPSRHQLVLAADVRGQVVRDSSAAARVVPAGVKLVVAADVVLYVIRGLASAAGQTVAEAVQNLVYMYRIIVRLLSSTDNKSRITRMAGKSVGVSCF